jgi:hypothetical protein
MLQAVLQEAPNTEGCVLDAFGKGHETENECFARNAF